MRTVFLVVSVLAVGVLVLGPWDTNLASPLGAGAGCSAAAGGGVTVSNTAVSPTSSVAPPSCTFGITP